MSEEKKDKKKKKTAIIAGIVGSAVLIGGVTAGSIITTTETESETEENKKNKSRNAPNPNVPRGQKTDLSTITKLTGLDLFADSSKTFLEIEDEINKNALEFEGKTKIDGLYSVTRFYDSPTSNNNLRLQNQRKGDFWIVIKVSSLEPNWYGKTPKIKITLK